MNLEHKKNLFQHTLRAFERHDELVNKFNMGTFCGILNPHDTDNLRGDLRSFSPLETPEVFHNCGTVACFAGLGPVLGIPALTEEKWGGYIHRVFGVSSTGGSFRTWDWLFDTEHVNSLMAAIKRAAYLLDKEEIPVDEDMNVCIAEVPEDYEIPWKKLKEKYGN